MSAIARAIQDIQRGALVFVTDDSNRENEGDLIMAADRVTPTALNFMITYGRGLVCVAITGSRARALRLSPMVKKNTAQFQTRFTVSVDAVRGTGSGISVFDRAATIRAIVNPATAPKDLRRPGHIFPLVADRRGVLGRAGHTEAAVDLAWLAGLTPAGVLCEILNTRGAAANRSELKALARRHRLTQLTIAELAAYRRRHEV